MVHPARRWASPFRSVRRLAATCGLAEDLLLSEKSSGARLLQGRPGSASGPDTSSISGTSASDMGADDPGARHRLFVDQTPSARLTGQRHDPLEDPSGGGIRGSSRALGWSNRRNGDHPLLGPTFVDGFLRHFGSKGLASRFPSIGPPGLAFVERTKLGSWQTFQPSQAPLADHDGRCSCLWAGRRSAPVSPWVCLGFLGVAAGSKFHCVARIQPRRRSASVSTIFRLLLSQSGWLDVYWQSRGKNLGDNLTRQRRRLAQRRRTPRARGRSRRVPRRRRYPRVRGRRGQGLEGRRRVRR